MLRAWLKERLIAMHLESIEIERNPNVLHIIIKTSRPGMIIGRSGEGVERLKDEIKKKILKLWKKMSKTPEKRELRLTIEEVRSPEMQSAIAARVIVEELEKRIPFRRIMRQTIEKISSIKGVRGVKVALKGRLDGSEMARHEWLRKGRIPLQTLRADVDYAEDTAFTTYGTIGVKVWIYKGDIFEKSETRNPKS